MPKGLSPRKYKDHRRYSARTFGSAGIVPDDFTVDKGLTNPDQNEPDDYWGNPALPYGCTGFATADIATNEDGIIYDPRFTYDKTLLIQNGKEGDTCSLQDSFKAATVYGVRAKGESDAEALTHRRGPYFETQRDIGQSWLDALAQTTWNRQKAVSCGTPWVMWFNMPDEKGRVTYVLPSKKASDYRNWHDWNFSGTAMIDGVKYARVKSWQGKWLYFSKEAIEAMMSVPGSDNLTCSKAQPGDIQIVELNILQVLISLYYRYIASKFHA